MSTFDVEEYNNTARAIREMTGDVRRNIRSYIADVRRTNNVGSREDVHVDMLHDEADDHDFVDAREHRAESCRERVAMWNALRDECTTEDAR